MDSRCHRRERAQSFRKNNFVSHVPKGMLTRDEAELYIHKLESYFDSLAEKKPYKSLSEGSTGHIHIKESSRDLNVEISGNSQHGALKIRSGLSVYSEIHYSPRAIHLYRSEHNGGPIGQEVAVYLSRQLPNGSFGFGMKSHLESVLKTL